ncbi:MAG: LysR family transcriptional regulator [Rhodocyclaceae bacterium]|nr:LysR family transcriptional regulator [Rhodocyclaceae bacterium]MDP1940802.1 LysR family transcriptional regulator [Gallionella sp.]
MIINDLNTFCEVVDLGSFSAVARKRGVTPSTIAKAISRLECRTNSRLFYRNTRSLSLTPEGDKLFELSPQFLRDSEELLQKLSSTHNAVSGVLRLDIPVFLGRIKVLNIIQTMAEQFATLKFDITLSDAYNDIVSDGTDVAIRIGDLPDSSMVAKKIGEQEWVLCCSPGYHQSLAGDLSIDKLEDLDTIGFRLPRVGKIMPWRFADNQEINLSANRSKFIMTCGEAMKHMALSGLGVAQLPNYMVDHELKNGSLVELLPDYRPVPTPIFAVLPNRKYIPGRVRFFMEELDKVFRTDIKNSP